jgi:hypothetical protein
MSKLQNMMRRTAGLFVDFDENADPDMPTPRQREMPAPTSAPVTTPAPSTPAPKTVEQIVKETEGPNLDQVNAVPVENKPVFRADGGVDFEGIFQLAGLTPVAFGAEQVLDLLAQLPAELPLEAKRATLKVTIGAMAKTSQVSSDTIVGDTMRKLAALATYSENFERQANEYIGKAQAEIERLRGEIAKWEKGIGDATAKSQMVEQACVTESERLDDVLEFFSLDVPPSRHA